MRHLADRSPEDRVEDRVEDRTITGEVLAIDVVSIAGGTSAWAKSGRQTLVDQRTPVQSRSTTRGIDMTGSLPMLGWLWPTLIVIGLALIAVGMIVLVRRGSGPTTGGTSTARELLDARYARGEIDDAEYRHRRDLLP